MLDKSHSRSKRRRPSTPVVGTSAAQAPTEPGHQLCAPLLPGRSSGRIAPSEEQKYIQDRKVRRLRLGRECDGGAQGGRNRAGLPCRERGRDSAESRLEDCRRRDRQCLRSAPSKDYGSEHCGQPPTRDRSSPSLVTSAGSLTTTCRLILRSFAATRASTACLASLDVRLRQEDLSAHELALSAEQRAWRPEDPAHEAHAHRDPPGLVGRRSLLARRHIPPEGREGRGGAFP